MSAVAISPSADVVNSPEASPSKGMCTTDSEKGKAEGSPSTSDGRARTASTTCSEDSPLRTPLGGDDRDGFANAEGSPGAEGKAKSTVPDAIAEDTRGEEDDENVTAKDSEVPSRGSVHHEGGSCSPCVWFWKPQGCQRGRECGYCHLCPEGEIKSRKKAKLATIRATASNGSKEDGDDADSPTDMQQQQSSQNMTVVGSDQVTTPGSALHGTGECRPCAWFYKPQGCLNGEDCRHCHLCPEGEIKARKKNKVDMIRTCSAQSESSIAAMVEAQSGHETSEIPPPPGLVAPKLGRAPSTSVGAALHGTGECRPCAWYHKAQGCQNGVECRHCHMCPEGEIKVRRKMRSTPTMTSSASNALFEDVDEQDDDDEGADAAEVELDSQPEPAKVMLPLASRKKPVDLPSPGSDLHGTGQCRPCAWFHKPGGCENGAECRHCHLCPEGEIRNRRKNKVAAMKQAASQEQEMGMEQTLWAVQKQQEALLAASWQAQWEAAATAMAAAQAEEAAAYALSPMGLDPITAAAAATMGSAAAIAATAAMMGAASPMGSPIGSPMGFGLPSAGSALHALGKCRPCAWFWKPQGCQNGQACAHCHLCPQGELKARKRMKEAAMRTGGMSPSGSVMSASPTSGPKAGRSLSTRSEPRVVKIASCLDN
mmetsp:Transcript_49027/g.140924  ORF Transcript_49027/g.140924 Transcript_49027/m.140924 type:complete len:654 (+) Transcript_49027:131-2092(+)